MSPTAQEKFNIKFDSIPRDWFGFSPDIGMILGSGWSKAVEDLPFAERLPFSAIPSLGAASIAGHSGEIRLLEHNGARVVLFMGRRHYYEGLGWGPVVYPVELLRKMGCGKLVLTNAAGGINPSYRPGDLVIVKDHINLTGLSPLIGPVADGWGKRFPDQSSVYDKGLALKAKDIMQRAGYGIKEGVYSYSAGPAFETPAEIKAYRLFGADLAGMSTVHEASVASAIGMKVLAVSCVTNPAAGLSPRELSHEEVLDATAAAQGKMKLLLTSLIGA